MGKLVRNVVVVGLALLWMVPVYLLVVNSVTTPEGYTGSPQWLPTSFGLFGNIGSAWTNAQLGPSFVNSLEYAVVCGGVAVAVSTLAAFGVVVAPTRRPMLWFWVIYSGTLLPLQIFLAPLFKSYARENLYDTRLGMGLIYTALCVPFAFFVVRNYLTTIPREIVEASKLDGAPWWSMFWRIHVPLSRPAMAAAFLFQATWVWNDLIFGITLSTSPGVRPIMAALANLNGNYSHTPPPVVLAGALLVSLPTLLLFGVFQRFFTTSLRAGV